MGALFKRLDAEDALEHIKNTKYAIGQFISSYEVGSADSICRMDMTDCIEARYFTDDREVHVFRSGDQMVYIEVSDGDSQYYDEEYEIEEKFEGVGKYVVVRNYVNTDDDGQCCITGKRLVCLKEA